VALPFYIKKYHVKAKEEELWKLKNISLLCKKYNLQKNSSERNPKSFHI
jgi:hypothetical protein